VAPRSKQPKPQAAVRAAPTHPYTGLAVPKYNKDRKRLSKGVLKALNDAQAGILQAPFRGGRKQGALSDVWVEKFKADNDQWLVAYEIDTKKNTVTFLAVGQHENYYRDLERYRAATTANARDLK
jgi:mRNA interferase RelE/StbE